MTNTRASLQTLDLQGKLACKTPAALSSNHTDIYCLKINTNGQIFFFLKFVHNKNATAAKPIVERAEIKVSLHGISNKILSIGHT